MPTKADPTLSVRFAPEGYRRLRELAAARRVSLSGCVRQLVDEAAPDEPRRHLSEDTFATLDGKHRGAVIGTKLAERLNVDAGIDSITFSRRIRTRSTR